jgi:selenocysteine lyase/cysteine desulfurase
MAELPQLPDDEWAKFRSQMPVTQRWAYFDHAAVAPVSGPAQQAIRQWSQQAAEHGDTLWSQWSEGIEATRRSAASVLGARPEEIALVQNTTAGISLIAEGYPWSDGDNVVTLENEFPSNLYPWMNLASRGVQTRRVAVDGARVTLDRIASACDSRTRIVSVSWVGYASGWRTDIGQLAELVHDRGALLFVDAIQGMGVFPLDVKQTPVDFLAADGHKWMLGPEGAGFLFVRGEHLDLLRPMGVGWNSVVHAHDFSRIELDLRPSAARYEGGSQNMAGFLALGASLRLLQQFGLTSQQSPIAGRVLELTDRACERLGEIGAEIVSVRQGAHRSGIVAFRFSGRDLRAIRQHCLGQGVALGYRAGCLRISPHAYVNEDDIERLIEALKDS